MSTVICSIPSEVADEVLRLFPSENDFRTIHYRLREGNVSELCRSMENETRMAISPERVVREYAKDGCESLNKQAARVIEIQKLINKLANIP